jgi:nucleotide-binding universal stress UspA family protein
MARYKKILVAFDGSDSSKNALRQAIKLARTEKSWIKVVSVVPDYQGDLELVGVHNIESAIRGPAEKLLDEAKKIAAEEGMVILTNIEQGEAYEKIVDVADAENCDLIVMGRKGHHRLERALLGCVTARVIGHTERDVLVVPKDASIDFSRILLATEGSTASDAATERAIDYAKSYGAELEAVAVVDVTDEFHTAAPAAVEKFILKFRDVLDALKAKAEAAGVKVKTVIKEGETYEVIRDFAEDEKANLIVLGSHGRKGLSKVLMGSVTEKVIGLTSCPVLVVRS